jgi:surface polysaccharide O-acyltransferase-like enzyme
MLFFRKVKFLIGTLICQRCSASLNSSNPPKSLTHLPVDVIRTIAILGVILLHAANDLTIQQLNTFEIFRWCTVDVYQTIGRIGVPLFIMLSGALLLGSSKETESIKEFFKKRWVRIGIPFLFLAVIYFAWDIWVNQKAPTVSFFVQGLLTGPYFQFWYIYMLAGLYLLTPALRVLMAHASRSTIKFTLAVWFAGSALLPILALLTPYRLDANVLTVPTYVGYYILGTYLLRGEVRLKRSQIAGFIVLGVALTAIFTYALAATIGGATMFYFQDYQSATMVLTSVMVFLLILSYAKQPKHEAEPKRVSWGRRLLHVVSENTLAIYFLHLLVLEVLQKGMLGFALNGNTVNSMVGVPLATVVTLGLCLAIILPLKRIPYLKKLIG